MHDGHMIYQNRMNNMRGPYQDPQAVQNFNFPVHPNQHFYQHRHVMPNIDPYQQKMFLRQQQFFNQQAGTQKVQSVRTKTNEKYLINVVHPNNFDAAVFGSCSYCFMPMRSQQDIARHTRMLQECYNFAQAIAQKCTWPCPYCGLESNGPSKFLQQHIQSAHPSCKILKTLQHIWNYLLNIFNKLNPLVYHQFRHTKSIALPFQCQKCLLSFDERMLLDLHSESCTKS